MTSFPEAKFHLLTGGFCDIIITIKYKAGGDNKMTTREYVRTQIETLPDVAIEKLADFIAYQKFSLEIYEDDTDYLMSVPGMEEKITKGMATPLNECLDSVGWDIN